MAFLIKNTKERAGSSSQQGQAIVSQWIHVTRPTLLLPATTSQILFRVRGGRVLVQYFLGEVTTVLDATDPVISINSKKLSNASVAIGTAVAVASTTNIASLEVGGTVNILGSGAAVVKNNAGAALSTLGRIPWVAPQGEIYLTTGGTNLTGFMKWDLWYQPLDAGAYVEPIGTVTAVI